MVSHLVQPVCSSTDSEALWRELYPRLQLSARYTVHTFHTPYWYGQEEDIVEDITQETVCRMIERTRTVEKGEASPTLRPEQMMTVVARNYCSDLRRRDRRLRRLPGECTEVAVKEDLVDLSELATESVYRETLFTLIAREVVKFPQKQREALLTDMANRMSFDSQATPLQQAFLNVGISLQDYQKPLPTPLEERRRHTALLHYAYKRIAHLSSIQQYIAHVE